MSIMKKLKLHGFNNLTKTLSFNIYDICYAKSRADRKEYLAYLDEAYNSTRLVEILRGVAARIGATILDISSQDYEPMGASVTVLIAEGSPVVMSLIQSGRIDAVVGVSCLETLESVYPYMEAGAVPGIAIPLLQGAQQRVDPLGHAADRVPHRGMHLPAQRPAIRGFDGQKSRGFDPGPGIRLPRARHRCG